MENEYFRVKDLCDKFNLSYRSILKAIKSGRIRAFKVGDGRRNPYLIPKSEILRIEISGMIEINPKFSDD